MKKIIKVSNSKMGNYFIKADISNFFEVVIHFNFWLQIFLTLSKVQLLFMKLKCILRYHKK